MWQKFEDWVEKKEYSLKIIFLLVIPAIAGIVLATFGFLENGFLGSLAGLIRGVLFTYLAYLPIFLIFLFLSYRDNRYWVIGSIISILIWAVIYFIGWFITNY